jgi:MFS family permease
VRRERLERTMKQRSTAVHRRRLGRPFTRLWSGFALASSGDGLAYGAVPLLAVAVDPHPFAVSVVVAADSLPWLLLAVPAGHLADRFDRSRIIALTNALRAAAMLAAAVLIVHYRISLALLIAIVLVNASGRTIYFSSVQAMAPGLIDDRDLEHANGILYGTEAGAEELAGPVVGTILFSVAKALPFLTDGLALLTSSVPFLGFRTKTPEPEEGEAPSSPSMLEGVRLLFADHRLRVLLFLVASLAGLQGMEGGVLVLLATKEWGVSQGAYGLFLAAGAAGALFGSFLADGISRRIGGARTLIAAATASGLGYLVMASAMNWTLAGPAFVLVGLAIGAGSVVAMSLRQRLTPEDLMGRVGGAWRGIVWGLAPIGALAAGGIAVAGGLRLPLVVAGILQCLVALVLARPLLKSIEQTRPSRRMTPPLSSPPGQTLP